MKCSTEIIVGISSPMSHCRSGRMGMTIFASGLKEMHLWKHSQSLWAIGSMCSEITFLALKMTLSARTNKLCLPASAVEPGNGKSVRRKSQPA